VVTLFIPDVCFALPVFVPFTIGYSSEFRYYRLSGFFTLVVTTHWFRIVPATVHWFLLIVVVCLFGSVVSIVQLIALSGVVVFLIRCCDCRCCCVALVLPSVLCCNVVPGTLRLLPALRLLLLRCSLRCCCCCCCCYLFKTVVERCYVTFRFALDLFVVLFSWLDYVGCYRRCCCWLALLFGYVVRLFVLLLLLFVDGRQRCCSLFFRILLLFVVVAVSLLLVVVVMLLLLVSTLVLRCCCCFALLLIVVVPS